MAHPISRTGHKSTNIDTLTPQTKPKKLPRQPNYFRQLAHDLIHPPKDTVLTQQNVTSSSNILRYNRRLILPTKVPRKLKKEFDDAQKHLNDCPVDPSKWDHANPDQCIAPHSQQTIANAGIAHLQGIRPTMEDAHLVTMLTITVNGIFHAIPLYGIFDGHGGADCANFLANNLGPYLSSHLQQSLAQATTPQEEDAAIFNALKLAFVNLGAQYQKLHNVEGGSTANIAFIYKNQLWVANVGDTRAILIINGIPIALSEDAKPALEKYKQGVENRHGTVIEINGIARVEGNLAVARAVGHSEVYSGINPRPKIIKFSLDQLPKDKPVFLLIACDGLWDVASSNQVAKTVNDLAQKPPAEITGTLVRKGFAAGSQDNISTLIVPL